MQQITAVESVGGVHIVFDVFLPLVLLEILIKFLQTKTNYLSLCHNQRHPS